MTENTKQPETNDVSVYDFENDEKISERRKEACRKNYEDMTLDDIDCLFTSAYKHDKKTNSLAYKKPRSLHELVYLGMRRNYDLLDRLMKLEDYVVELGAHVMKLKDDKERKA